MKKRKKPAGIESDDLIVKPTSDIFTAVLWSAPKNEPILRDFLNAVLIDSGQLTIRLSPENIIPFFVIPAHAGIQKNRLKVARLVHHFLIQHRLSAPYVVSLAQRHKVHKELNCRKFLCVLRAFVRNIIYLL